MFAANMYNFKSIFSIAMHKVYHYIKTTLIDYILTISPMLESRKKSSQKI